jgi:hypothetical protein
MLDHDWKPSHAAPARDVRKKRFGKSLVYFPSRKNRTQLICESHNEADMCLLLEYQTQVIQYYIQPVSYSYDTRKKSSQYTPDFFVQQSCDRDYFIELKGRFLEQAAPYRAVLESFANTADKLGYGFEVFALSDYPADCTLDNLGLLYSRSHLVTAYEQRQLAECLNEWTGELSISLLLLHESRPTLRAVCAAIFEQKLTFDLSKMLCLDTPLFVSGKEPHHNEQSSSKILSIAPRLTVNG